MLVQKIQKIKTKKKFVEIDESKGLPYERWIEICQGMIGIPSQDFWQMSVFEVSLAIKGLSEFNSGKKSSNEPMTLDRIEKLKERYPDI